ncbi:ribosome maturation factor RimP [Christensenellaceae bacterium OttesenSCG-928-M15]|nr:ribosome maturation factor RimP [Christensenellaceae bacterium OttesenSCG-928-M15]
MKTTEIVRELVEGTVTALGYDLVDVEFKKEQAGWVLTFFIDKQDGVSLDDCERVSREIDPILDEADPIAQPYYLSVSSPGLDRPLKTDKDLLRYLEKPVIVKLYAQVEKKKEFTGELKGVDEQTLTLVCNDKKERVFLRKDIAQVKPHIDFN